MEARERERHAVLVLQAQPERTSTGLQLALHAESRAPIYRRIFQREHTSTLYYLTFEGIEAQSERDAREREAARGAGAPRDPRTSRARRRRARAPKMSGLHRKQQHWDEGKQGATEQSRLLLPLRAPVPASAPAPALEQGTPE